MKERIALCFSKPDGSTSSAGCFSHCVFFLSFGTSSAFSLSTGRMSLLTDLGKREVALAVFVVFDCGFCSLVS